LILLGLVIGGIIVVAARQRPQQAIPEQIIPSVPAPSVGERPAQMPTRLPDIQVLLTAMPTATPLSQPAVPARLEIRQVGIDVLVSRVGLNSQGLIFTPVYAAGYWDQSAPLSKPGNTILVGHVRTEPQEVFLHLKEVDVGDVLKITDQYAQEYFYKISEKEVIQIVGGSDEDAQRLRNYIQPTDTARLTMIACYPDASCPSRLVIMALPVDQ
jgi:LPXTG-site transpeptidase (sortase) family protein